MPLSGHQARDRETVEPSGKPVSAGGQLRLYLNLDGRFAAGSLGARSTAGCATALSQLLICVVKTKPTMICRRLSAYAETK